MQYNIEVVSECKKWAGRFAEVLKWFDIEINEEAGKMFAACTQVAHHYWNYTHPDEKKHLLGLLQFLQQLGSSLDGIRLSSLMHNGSTKIESTNALKDIFQWTAKQTFRLPILERYGIGYSIMNECRRIDTLYIDDLLEEYLGLYEDLYKEKESEWNEEVKWCIAEQIAAEQGWEVDEFNVGYFRKKDEPIIEAEIGEIIDRLIKEIQREDEKWCYQEGKPIRLYGAYARFIIDSLPMNAQTFDKSTKHNIAGAILEVMGIFDNYSVWHKNKGLQDGRWQYNNQTQNLISKAIKAAKGYYLLDVHHPFKLGATYWKVVEEYNLVTYEENKLKVFRALVDWFVSEMG